MEKQAKVRFIFSYDFESENVNKGKLIKSEIFITKFIGDNPEFLKEEIEQSITCNKFNILYRLLGDLSPDCKEQDVRGLFEAVVDWCGEWVLDDSDFWPKSHYVWEIKNIEIKEIKKNLNYWKFQNGMTSNQKSFPFLESKVEFNFEENEKNQIKISQTKNQQLRSVFNLKIFKNNKKIVSHQIPTAFLTELFSYILKNDINPYKLFKDDPKNEEILKDFEEIE